MVFLMASLGELCMGLTWGWLIGRFGGPHGCSKVSLASLVAATVLAAGEVVLFRGWRGFGMFLAAAGAALLLRLVWHRELRRRLDSST